MTAATLESKNILSQGNKLSSTFSCREESQFLGQLIPMVLKINYIIEENKTILSMIK